MWRPRRRKEPARFDPEAGEAPENLGLAGPPGPSNGLWWLIAMGVAALIVVVVGLRFVASDGSGQDDDDSRSQQNGPAFAGPSLLSRASAQLPQARGWPLPSEVWKLEPQAQDFVAFGLKMEKPLFMMSST